MTDVLTRIDAAPQLTSPLNGSADSFAGTVAEGLALAVAPTTGRFQPCGERPLDGGAVVRAGQLLGHVTGGRGRADEVRAPVDGIINALLVRAGQQVRRGQELAWLSQGPWLLRAAAVSEGTLQA